MGDFVRQVQNEKIPGPLRRQFTPGGWKTHFEKCGVPDGRDKNVYDAGLVIHEKLQNIRSRLKLSTSASLSATTKLRAFVAAVNHHFLVAKSKANAAIAKLGELKAMQQPDGLRMDELVASVKLDLPGGFEWSPAEIVESLVDGIEIPVRLTLAASPVLSGNPRMRQVEWSDILLELNMGIFYRHAEDLWEDCLWNDYELIDSERLKVFIPRDADVKRAHCMGTARRSSFTLGLTALSTKIHRDLVYQGHIKKMPEVRSIERQGRHQIIAVEVPEVPSMLQEQYLANRLLASEPYYAELLEEAHAALGGLSLNHLLDAWNVVSRSAALLLEQVSVKHEAGVGKEREPHAWLPDYAPILQIESLTKVISSVVRVDRAASKRLVEFLTFKGQAGQETWAQPLVPVGNGTVAPIFSASIVPNLRRLVDVWLRQLGVDLGRRGPAFEAYLRSSAQNSIDQSPILAGNAWCMKNGYTFRPSNGRSEEIDLLLIVGSTVIVAEAKCILEPTDSKSMAMHRRTVLGAGDQANRKSAAIDGDRPSFIADIKKHGVDLPQDFKVIPLVVVSTTAHVGVPANGVPVVDEYILSRFLDGELEDVAIMGRSLAIKKTLKTVFYSDVGEAEARLAQYFSDPPQVRRLKAGVKGRMVPFHGIDDNDWQGMVFTLECVPTDPERAVQDV